MTISVFCTTTEPQADVVIRNLKTAGFRGEDISVLMADKRGTSDFAITNQTKAPEGAVTGYGTGFAIGGTLGLLVGIGALAIPGAGPFIAAGPLMAALGGAAVGGVVGTITGALVGMGIPEYEAVKYEGKVKEGSTLISVHSISSEQTELVRSIYEDAGAQDISTAGELEVPEETASTRSRR